MRLRDTQVSRVPGHVGALECMSEKEKMNLFSFLRSRPAAMEIKTRQELPGLETPLTARQAFAAVVAEVGKIDSQFKFTFVGSSEDIDALGRASSWDFLFSFSRRRALGSFRIEPCSGIEADGPGPACMEIHIKPLAKEVTWEGKRLEVRGLAGWLEKSWDESDRARPALPLEFRDSPEAVIALAGQGADFVAGGIHMTLASKVLDDGQSVWHTDSGGQEFHTPFALSVQGVENLPR